MKGEFQVIRIGICVFSHFIGRSSLASWTASIMTWNATLSHPLTVGICRLICEVATRKEPLCDWPDTTESDRHFRVQTGYWPHATGMRPRPIQTA